MIPVVLPICFWYLCAGKADHGEAGIGEAGIGEADIGEADTGEAGASQSAAWSSVYAVALQVAYAHMSPLNR